MSTPSLSFHNVAEIRCIRKSIRSSKGAEHDFETVTIRATDINGQAVELLLYAAEAGLPIIEGEQE